MQPSDLPINPETLLRAYAAGVFPMSESRTDPAIFWVDPRMRGILPLYGFHVSRSLARRIRSGRYNVTYDMNFPGVVEGCADREETWINRPIFDLYVALHDMGRAHSIEVWDAGRLVGGSYGVALGAAWFGESMFSRSADASKVALAHLVDRLATSGFSLFDTQFPTLHLASLGGKEVPRSHYRAMLLDALDASAQLDTTSPMPAAEDLLKRLKARAGRKPSFRLMSRP